MAMDFRCSGDSTVYCHTNGNTLNFSEHEFNYAPLANFVSTNLKTSVLQISLAFENCVGYCACFVLQFYTVVMRVKGHTLRVQAHSAHAWLLGKINLKTIHDRNF